MSTHAQRFIVAMAGKPAKEWFMFGHAPQLFEDDPLAAKAYAFIDTFARKHGSVPSAATLKEHVGLVIMPEPGEPPFLFAQLLERRVRKQLALTGEELQKLIAANDPMQALSLMYATSKSLMGEVKTPRTFDFKQANTTLWPHLIEKWSGSKEAVPLPWQTLDQMTGGVYGGEMISTIGRPGKGKTWLKLYMAYHAWRTTERPVVFGSQEMMARKIMERLAALHTGISVDLMKDGLAGDFFGQDVKMTLKDSLLQLESSDLPPFIITDGSLASTVDDLVAVCHRFEPVACYVDGAYLLKPGKTQRFLKNFEKIEYVCEALKQDIATDLDIPVFPSWQFNRESTKVKPGQEGLEHIAGGDTIGQLSSVVLALLGDTGDADNPEAGSRRLVRILKGRDGEQGELKMLWNFDNMQFGEVVEGADAPVYGLG